LPFFEQTATLCGWLLPGPYSGVDAVAPFLIAIWPAVWPFPYCFVLFEPAAAVVLWVVVELGFTPVELSEAVGCAAAAAACCFFAWPGGVEVCAGAGAAADGAALFAWPGGVPCGSAAIAVLAAAAQATAQTNTNGALGLLLLIALPSN
jgi:hypothetical protein